MNKLKEHHLNIIAETVNTQLNVDLVNEKKKLKVVIDAKKIFCLIARNLTSCTTTEIGKFLGLDHSSILYLSKKAKEHIEYDKDFDYNYRLVVKNLPPISIKKELELKYQYHIGVANKIKRKIEALV